MLCWDNFCKLMRHCNTDKELILKKITGRKGD